MPDVRSVDASKLKKGIQMLDDKATLAMFGLSDTIAKDFENYAKINRPWTDRTGRARQGLTGYVKKVNRAPRIVIAHTVTYGVDLELKRNKKYAILEPTIRLKSGDAVSALKRLMDKITVY